MASKNWAIAKDTWIAEFTPTSGNLGAGKNTESICGRFTLGGYDYIGRVLMQFTLDWTNVYQITSATLHFRTNDTAYTGAAPHVDVKRNTSTWSEGTEANLSPSNATVWDGPTMTTSGQVLDYALGAEGWESIDITAFADAWAPSSVKQSGGSAGAGAANDGLTIKAHDESSGTNTQSIEMRESAYDAYITLVYTTNDPPTVDSITIDGNASGTYIAGSDVFPSIEITATDPDADTVTFINADLKATTGLGIQPASWSSPDATVTSAPTSGVLDWHPVAGTTRGTWYCIRARATDSKAGYGGYTYAWYYVNRLPTVTLTEPSASGRLAKLSFPSGSGYNTPRLDVSWTYADADGDEQVKYEVQVATDSGGSPGSTVVSGDVTSEATEAVINYDLTEGNYYHIRVRVYDGLEYSSYTSWLRVRARWGLSTHKHDLGSTPSTWSVTGIDTTTDATKNAVVIEYNSSTDGTTIGTWKATLGEVTKKQWLHYRVWFLAWGASPGTAASLNAIDFDFTTSTVQPDFWLPNPLSGIGAQLDPSSHAFGTQALRIDGNGTTRIAYQQIAVDPETDYVLQARVKSIGNSGALVALSDTSSGTALLSTTALTADADWVLKTGPTYWNSGARTSVYVQLVVTGASGTSGLFDGIKVERGRVTSTWTPGFIGEAITLDAGGMSIDASAGGILRLRGADGTSTVELNDGLLFNSDTELTSPSTGRFQANGVNLLLATDSVGISHGTTMPASPAQYDFYARDDLGGLIFQWDGYRWYCVCPHHLSLPVFNISATAAYAALSATLGGSHLLPTPLVEADDIYLQTLITKFFVNGGTALSAGSHQWVGTFNRRAQANTDVAVGTITIASGSLSVWRRDTMAIAAMLQDGYPSIYELFGMGWTKTGTPGNLYALPELSYRHVTNNIQPFAVASGTAVTTGTSVTGVLPTGWAAGDTVIQVVTGLNRTNSTPSVSTPTGWTAIDDNSQIVSTLGHYNAAFYRVMQGGDAAPTFTLGPTLPSNSRAIVHGFAFKAKLGTLAYSTGKSSFTSGTSFTFPAVTQAAKDQYLIYTTPASRGAISSVVGPAGASLLLNTDGGTSVEEDFSWGISRTAANPGTAAWTVGNSTTVIPMSIDVHRA